jgi:ABC-2 type transport system permease protein
MNAFLYGVGLRWKIDFRNKGVLLTYYIVPLLFFAFMSGIFSSINPASIDTLIQSMTVFSVSMGSLLGSPIPLVELYGSEIKKAYKVGGIPMWVPAVNNFISSFIHLYIVSLIIFFISPIAFGSKVPNNLPLYFISLAAFIMVSVAVGTILGLMVKSETKLTMVSQFVFLPSLMLSGIMFPASMLPKVMETVGKIFPATSGFTVMSSNVFDITMFIPLIIVFVLAVVVCIVKLNRMAK